MSESERLEQLELEQQNAAMREALIALGMSETHPVLQPDAGRSFIPREKVQPLVDALKLLQADGMPLDNSGQRPMHAWLNHETFVKARLALSHAKTLGFE